MTRLAALAAAAALWLGAHPAQARAAPDKPSPCAGPEYHRLDFWIGDWDVYDIENLKTPSARARIDAILGGCALREQYEGGNGLVGQSFTIYDAGRKLWHQTWVTNRGRLLTIEGRFDGDTLTLVGPQYGDDGRKELIRGTWKAERGGVREVAHSSTDGGADLAPALRHSLPASQDGSGHARRRRRRRRDRRSMRHAFAGRRFGLFVGIALLLLPLLGRARARAAQADDVQAVAALDERYQAAVKSNDAETMARILADDFVLVTGRGKVHTKAELLEDARRKTATYEHQEDTQRTVRVWGDTAVVTALLWEKGVDRGQPFDYHVWFSDTYVRAPGGWKYVFGQASLPLPKP